MAVYKYIFFLLLYCLQANTASAQSGNTKTILLQDGGKPVKITCTFKNSQGIIFTGTEHGLFLFDGTPAYRKIPVKGGLTDTIVTALFEDGNRQLWAGYANGNIAHLNHQGLVQFNPEEGTPKKAITCFAQDKSGRIWFATRGEGIYYIEGRHLYNIDDADGLSDENVYCLRPTESGEMLAATDQGINICQVSGAQKKITVLGTADGLPDNLVTSIIPAGDNQFWIGLQDKGICRYNHVTRSFSDVSTSWSYGAVSHLCCTDRTLWIAAEGYGLLQQQFSASGKFSRRLQQSFTETTVGLLTDDEGNCWIAAGNKMIRNSGEKLKLLPPYSEGQFSGTHALLADNEGNVWAGSSRGIIQYLREPDGYKTRLHSLPLLTASNVITSLYQDVQGSIWIGTMGKGVFLLNPKTGSYRSFNELPPPADRSILSITGRGNTICISSLEGAVTVTPAATPAGSFDIVNYTSAEGIGRSYVNSIYKDSKDRLWFATFGKGLTVFSNGTYTTYDQRNGLKSNIVYAVTEDKKGNSWFSTEDAGVYKFDGQKFVNYATKQGLSSLKIAQLKADGQDNIVIVNQKGLDILNPVTGTVTYVGSNYGIEAANAEDLGCVAQDSAGAIYFSTPAGIAVYNSAGSKVQQPHTILEGVRIFLDDIDTAGQAIFRYDQDNISFRFTGLYYTDPEQVQYQYKLEGYNNDWVATKDKNAAFAKLPPGRYLFRVRSSLSEDFTGASEAVYAFVIRKAFWKTWWFLLLATLLAGALFYWYVKSREASLKHAERLRQEKIQFQFEVLRNQVNPHFLFNSFNTLISTIEENPSMAVAYVEQLADFFRNIVTYRDKDVITLREELSLLQTYYYLQQKRYGDHLQLTVAVDNVTAESSYIPPLTLQLLLENAVKHNAVSRETPLAITIDAGTGDILVVRNNINPKINRDAGAGMGLQNIISRYALLSSKQVQIQQNNQSFTVVLPMLKKLHVENFNH